VAGSPPVPVRRLDAGDVDVQVLALFHRDHLGGGLEAKLLHHGLEVVLPWTLQQQQQHRSTQHMVTPKWNRDEAG